MENENHSTKRCANCGDPLRNAKEMYNDFQTEAAEELYCPNCGHQKHFGVVHSE